MSAPRKGSRELRNAFDAAQAELRLRLDRIDQADPQDVHRTRVAARRLRSLCKTFRPLLGPTAQDYGRALQRLARLLGELRAIDVMTELRAMQAPAIGTALGAARELAVRRLRRRLRHPQNRRVLERCRSHEDAPVTLVPADISRTEALRRTRRAWRRAATRLQDAPAGNEALHELRIALKNARYAIECVDKTGADPERLLRRLRQAQDLLGAQRDLDTARCWLESPGIPAAAQRTALPQLQRAIRRVEAQLGPARIRLLGSGRRWDRAVTAAID